MDEDHEAVLDEHDARIAEQRLADIEAGRSSVIPLDRVERALGL
ncbi:hypothetical protein ACFOVU_14835 [Nocardiopsis sediminis]|uniref:Uncharacterized protein n=1 Tax=Nocardiopsis sediminis TaxID=1778267 RepID=A0ABV8FM56_9ACTN